MLPAAARRGSRRRTTVCFVRVGRGGAQRLRRCVRPAGGGRLGARRAGIGSTGVSGGGRYRRRQQIE